jgi:hypothetical protein
MEWRVSFLQGLRHAPRRLGNDLKTSRHSVDGPQIIEEIRLRETQREQSSQFNVVQNIVKRSVGRLRRHRRHWRWPQGEGKA